jgi:hypothetical protein
MAGSAGLRTALSATSVNITICPGFDFHQLGTEGALRDFRIVGRLSAQPVSVRETEKPAKAQVGVGSNGALARHNVPMRCARTPISLASRY